MKYVGAVHLMYLGIRLLKDDKRFEIQQDSGLRDRSFYDPYQKAVLINVTNPQVAVFVFAVFPQFVPPTSNTALQLSFLGLVYAGFSLLYLVGVALFAGQVRHRLVGSTAAQWVVRYASGSVLVGFGLKLLLDGNRGF